MYRSLLITCTICFWIGINGYTLRNFDFGPYEATIYSFVHFVPVPGLPCTGREILVINGTALLLSSYNKEKYLVSLELPFSWFFFRPVHFCSLISIFFSLVVKLKFIRKPA